MWLVSIVILSQRDISVRLHFTAIGHHYYLCSAVDQKVRGAYTRETTAGRKAGYVVICHLFLPIPVAITECNRRALYVYSSPGVLQVRWYGSMAPGLSHLLDWRLSIYIFLHFPLSEIQQISSQKYSGGDCISLAPERKKERKKPKRT